MFKNKVAIVTGSGRGMGKAIAQDLAASGAKLIVCARTMSYGEETLAEFKAAGYEASLFQLDVTSHQGIRDLFAFAVQQYGGVDIVVHCAAENPFGFLAKISDEALDAVFTSILKSSVWLMQEASRHMANATDGGRMVFISSIAGNRTVVPGLVHYGAAKAGLNALVRGAALELAPKRITVNTIEPGLILTDRAKAALKPEQVEEISRAFPVPRAGSNDDIINAVRFLASPASSYVTGTSIVVDGGSTLSNAQAVSSKLAGH